MDASFIVSLQITMKKKTHTIREQLIVPCAQTRVKHSEEKLCVIFFSNDTVCRRICELSLDIKEQVVQKVKNAGLFSVQLDESTNVQSCSQLMVFIRYIHSGDLKEEFLFCDDLELTTKGKYVLEKLSEFFEAEGLDSRNLCAVCTDGALQCLGLDHAS